MAWKYMNPGDYRLLDNYISTNANIMDKNFAPRTGIGFLNGGNVDPVVLPVTKEIYMKFTASGEASYGFWIYFTPRPTNTNYRTGFIIEQNYNEYNGLRIVFYKNSYNYAYHYITKPTKKNIINIDLYCHIISGSNNGLVEWYVNGELKGTFTGNVCNGADLMMDRIDNSSFTLSYARMIISDIIISTEEINMNEHCAFVPIKVFTSPDWSYDSSNNIFVTDDINKTLTQTFDVDALKKQINLQNPTITGLQTKIIRPSVTNAEIIDSLRMDLKQNNSITNTQDKTITNNTNLNFDVLTENPNTNENWNINDLDDIEIDITTTKS